MLFDVTARSLQRIDVSHNLLSSTGVELLLMCVKVSSLYSLKLTGVINMFPSNHLDKHLETFLLKVSFMLLYVRLDVSGLYISSLRSLGKNVIVIVSNINMNILKSHNTGCGKNKG